MFLRSLKMNENTYKEIADKLKKEKGFFDLIGIGEEEEKTLWGFCYGNKKRYTERISKALDEWNNEKKKNKSRLEHKYNYDIYLNRQTAPLVIRTHYH